jgi:hypothetical protein
MKPCLQQWLPFFKRAKSKKPNLHLQEYAIQMLIQMGIHQVNPFAAPKAVIH